MFVSRLLRTYMGATHHADEGTAVGRQTAVEQGTRTDPDDDEGTLGDTEESRLESVKAKTLDNEGRELKRACQT
jgi:hypothetical protein